MNVKLSLRPIVLGLLIFQSLGIRFVPGQGILLLLVVVVTTCILIRSISVKHILRLLSIYLILTVLKLVAPSFTASNLVFMIGILTESYLLLIFYEKRGGMRLLEEDMYNVLRIFFIYALVNIVIYFIAKPLFFNTAHANYNYLTLYYLFFVDTIGRNTSIFWEPGVLQLGLNIFLFLAINRGKSIFTICLIGLVILSTQSTTGLMIFVLNFSLYFIKNVNLRRPRNIVLLFLIALFCFSVYSIIQVNLSNKFDVNNTSGLIRYRDILIGSELILDRPLLGHGIFDSEYLRSRKYVSAIEGELFSQMYMDRAGDMSGGYTNGLLAVFGWFGVPLGLVIFYMFYNNTILTEKRYVFLGIFCMTLISEPISYTPLFFLFVLSYFFKSSTVNVKKE